MSFFDARDLYLVQNISPREHFASVRVYIGFLAALVELTTGLNTQHLVSQEALWHFQPDTLVHLAFSLAGIGHRVVFKGD